MFTNAGLQKILNWFGGYATPGANPLYVALLKAEPTVAGANVSEPSNSTYARVAINTKTTSGSGTTKFGQATTGNDDTYITNSEAIYFPETYDSVEQVVQDWGTITHVGIFTAASGGTLLAYAALTSSIHPGEDSSKSNIVVIRANDMRIGIASGSASASAN